MNKPVVEWVCKHCGASAEEHHLLKHHQNCKRNKWEEYFMPAEEKILQKAVPTVSVCGVIHLHSATPDVEAVIPTMRPISDISCENCKRKAKREYAKEKENERTHHFGW